VNPGPGFPEPRLGVNSSPLRQLHWSPRIRSTRIRWFPMVLSHKFSTSLVLWQGIRPYMARAYMHTRQGHTIIQGHTSYKGRTFTAWRLTGLPLLLVRQRTLTAHLGDHLAPNGASPAAIQTAYSYGPSWRLTGLPLLLFRQRTLTAHLGAVVSTSIMPLRWRG
jgi:hypothetical protein